MLAVVIAVLIGVVCLVAQPRWTERRRARLQAKPFPAAWRGILRRHVPGVGLGDVGSAEVAALRRALLRAASAAATVQDPHPPPPANESGHPAAIRLLSGVVAGSSA